MKGKDLDKANLSRKKKKIYRELGKILKKIHSIKMKGFGWIEINGKGCFSSLESRILFNREKNLEFLKKNCLSEQEFINLTNYLKKSDSYSKSSESVLLHFDFEDFNIKVNEGKVIGILDFGDLSTGPRAYDLARVFISHYEDGLFNEFLKGYGKIDLNEMKYYVIISLLWMIPYHSQINKDEKRLKLELKILKELTKNCPSDKLLHQCNSYPAQLPLD